MAKEKKSILKKIFGGSEGCGCGVQIVDEDPKVKNDKDKSDKSK